MKKSFDLIYEDVILEASGLDLQLARIRRESYIIEESMKRCASSRRAVISEGVLQSIGNVIGWIAKAIIGASEWSYNVFKSFLAKLMNIPFVKTIVDTIFGPIMENTPWLRDICNINTETVQEDADKAQKAVEAEKNGTSQEENAKGGDQSKAVASPTPTAQAAPEAKPQGESNTAAESFSSYFGSIIEEAGGSVININTGNDDDYRGGRGSYQAPNKPQTVEITKEQLDELVARSVQAAEAKKNEEEEESGGIFGWLKKAVKWILKKCWGLIKIMAIGAAGYFIFFKMKDGIVAKSIGNVFNWCKENLFKLKDEAKEEADNAQNDSTAPKVEPTATDASASSKAADSSSASSSTTSASASASTPMTIDSFLNILVIKGFKISKEQKAAFIEKVWKKAGPTNIKALLSFSKEQVSAAIDKMDKETRAQLQKGFDNIDGLFSGMAADGFLKAIPNIIKTIKEKAPKAAAPEAAPSEGEEADF